VPALRARVKDYRIIEAGGIIFTFWGKYLENTFMDYKDLERGKTQNYFWFKAKEELIECLMEKTSQGKRNLKILNIGAGTGDDLKILNKFGGSYIVDINDQVLSLIDDNLCVEKRVADACDMPYADDYFDIVVSCDVFEHIEDDAKAAREIHRVLKNGGALIFMVPAFQYLYSSHDRALEHQRRYNKKRIKEVLGNFNRLNIFYWNSLLFLPMALMRIMKMKSKPQVDRINLTPWLNKVLFCFLSFDNRLIRKNISLPIGSSLVGFCYKNGSEK
jgi:ubiquinone/menaquinone biosynthesis C-methylase UbiE